MRTVVITGVGAISVLGLDHDSITTSLYEGRSGIITDASRAAAGFRSMLTGAVTGFDGAQYLNRKQRKSMPEFVQQAYAAARQALEQAQCPEQLLHSPRCGLIFGNDSTATAVFELAQLRQSCEATTSLGSGHMFKIMNSTASMNLGVLLGIHGASWTVSAACASGLFAIGQAMDAIRLGRQDIMICGAAQELDAEAVSAFDGLGAFSTHSVPQEASRPFDAQRDGLVPSGGAAALVLEEAEHARKRGVPILGILRGWGYSADGCELAAPSATGLSHAMSLALQDAQLHPTDITEINAHATSTPQGDAAEAHNIHAVFGPHPPRTLTLKSLTGHEFWMAGAAQIVYATLMAQRGFCAGSPHFTAGDAQTKNIPVLTRTIDQPPQTMLCNAAGFGGSNASCIVQFV